MTREQFGALLATATAAAVSFARTFVVDALPDEVRYLILPNQSYDGNPLVADEEIYPDDSLVEIAGLGPCTNCDVVSFLWRNGKVPEWIDVQVDTVANGVTIVVLRCCGRFTAREDMLYYGSRGTGPFSAKSPPLPPDWTKESGRFELDWRRKTSPPI